MPRSKAAQFGKPNLQKTRVLYLIVGAFALLFLGLVYAWSIFATPLQEMYGWSRSSLSITFSISVVMLCVGGLSSSIVAAKTSPKVSMILSAIFMSAGFALTSLLAPKGIWSVYLCYGVLVGAGCGFGYNSIVSTVNMWFRDCIGFASGVLLMCFGLGALILGTIADRLISAVGLTSTFYILAVAAIVILGVAASILRLPAEGSLKVFEKKQDNNMAQALENNSKSYSPGYMIKSLVFMLFLLWVVALASTGLTLIGDSKQGALLVGVSSGFATLLVGMVSTANGVSRIFMGVFCDRFGLTKAMTLISVSCLIAAMLLVVAFTNVSPVSYIVGALLMGFSYGGIPVMGSSFAMKRFGPKYYSTNFALANACMIPASFLSSAVGPAVRASAGDAMMYATFSAFVVLGLVFLFVFNLQYKKKIPAA